MKERRFFQPAALAQAIRDGRRAQARAPVRMPREASPRAKFHHFDQLCTAVFTDGTCVYSPFGHPGDRLWVPESWAWSIHSVRSKRDSDGPFVYASGDHPSRRLCRNWRSPITMPRWACRTVVEIVSVRVERLQDISARGCWAEGVPSSPDVDPVHEYRDIWESIHGQGSWDANPWVWVIEFRLVAT